MSRDGLFLLGPTARYSLSYNSDVIVDAPVNVFRWTATWLVQWTPSVDVATTRSSDIFPDVEARDRKE